MKDQKGCYLHSVQHSYENRSCKPEIKYFSSVNHQFTAVYSSVNWQITVKQWFTSINWQITVKQQFTLVNQQITVKWQFTSVNWWITAVYKCKLVDYSKAAVYKCKLVVYTCKVLNSRFTTVLLITLLDNVEVTPFFQFFFVKQWFTGVNCCFTINHHFTSCKLPLYCKPPLYKL